jgi:hypothetical protein
MKRLLTLILFAATSAAFAQQPGGRDEHRGPPKGPPQEALDACKGKRIGDAAQAKMPRGDIRTGTCQLVLVVDHSEGGGRQGEARQGENRQGKRQPQRQ